MFLILLLIYMNFFPLVVYLLCDCFTIMKSVNMCEQCIQDSFKDNISDNFLLLCSGISKLFFWKVCSSYIIRFIKTYV